MTLHLTNTLTGRKEPFVPANPECVTMYVCGPTVYDYAHIGNARPAVVFDVLARLLRHDYGGLVYARNFTDIDDKINAAAQAAGVPIGAITARFIAAYRDDMFALGVQPPDLEPRVTEHIDDIVALIQALLARGHAYATHGHVLFHVPSFAGYGGLSKRRPEDMLAGARVEVAPYKRDPLDFVLWKPSDASQPGWDSPWGQGRPGWHVECSAMIGRRFSGTLDLHGGGQDLIFPHHENEIAQGTCAHDGRLYCRTWVHNSFVTVDGRKMSKSLGNVHTLQTLLTQAPGEAIRMALLSAHYRHPLDWNTQRLSAAMRALRGFYRALAADQALAPAPDADADADADANANADAELLAALRDDLNVPRALARLHGLVGEMRRLPAGREQRHARNSLLASARLLGLLQGTPRAALDMLGSPQPGRDAPSEAHAAALARSPSPAWIEARLAEREQARIDRDFARADAQRDALGKAGIVLEDTADGPRWHRADRNALADA